MLAFAIARLRGFLGSRGVASRTELGPIGPLEHHARRVDGACMLEEAVSGNSIVAARVLVPSIAASQSWVKVTGNSPFRRIPHPIRALPWNLPACSQATPASAQPYAARLAPDNWSETRQTHAPSRKDNDKPLPSLPSRYRVQAR